MTGLVRTRDYNYRTSGTPMDSAVNVRNCTTTTGERYRYIAPFPEAGDDGTSEPETEIGAFYTRLYQERELKSCMVLEADGSNQAS